MDKETLSNYGWIVICILILAVMLALATPFGSFVAGAIKSTTAGLFMTNQNALGAAGIVIGDQEFDEQEEKDMSGNAYAIYTASDETLRFIRAEEAPQIGDLYNNEEITMVYSDIETINTYYDGEAEHRPWGSAKRVIVEDWIQPITTSAWFSNMRNATYFDVAKIDMSKVTDMSYMFAQAGRNNSVTTFKIVGMEKWDVSNVQNMTCALSFVGEYATTWSIGDLSGWKTTNVKSMQNLFSGCGQYAPNWTVGDLSGWNVSNVTHMQYIFQKTGMHSTTYELNGVDQWKPSSLENAFGAFWDTGLNVDYTIDLSSWSTYVDDDVNHNYFETNVETKIITPWE